VRLLRHSRNTSICDLLAWEAELTASPPDTAQSGPSADVPGISRTRKNNR
jgi:hypothetical protein